MFNQRLRELRDAKGLTQEALARLAGVTNMTVSKLELKDQDPRWSTVCKLADALGVSTEEFRRGPQQPSKGKRKAKGK